MEITLVCPPNVIPSHSLLSVRPPTPSTGVPYLAAALEQAGHSAHIIDALGLGLQKIRKLQEYQLYVRGLVAEEIIALINPQTQMVGISCMFSNEWLYVKKLIQEIRTALPLVKIVVGGEHVSADLDYVFQSCSALDYAIYGEGEETLIDLAEALGKGSSLAEVTGLAYRGENNSILKNAPRKRKRNLSELPWPNWQDIPLENYFSIDSGITSFRGRIMPILASRGCPYQCTFCSNPSMWGARWYVREAQDVIDEMKFYIAKYRVEHFEFHDLTAIVNRRWTLEFTSLLIKENLGVTWSLPSGTRSEALDKEVVKNLFLSGCKKISYAPESGSERTLAQIKKKVDLDKMIASMRCSISEGIFIRAHIIIGFPDQTLKDVWHSIRFIVRMAWIGVHDVSIYFFVPYPGSELFRRLQNEGKIPSQTEAYERFLAENVCNNTQVLSWSEHISDNQLKWISFSGMSMFYLLQFLLRPKRIIDLLFRLIRQKPITILDGLLYGKLWSKANNARVESYAKSF